MRIKSLRGRGAAAQGSPAPGMYSQKERKKASAYLQTKSVPQLCLFYCTHLWYLAARTSRKVKAQEGRK